MRFGAPDPATEAALAAMKDLERLERMGEAIFTAHSWQRAPCRRGPCGQAGSGLKQRSKPGVAADAGATGIVSPFCGPSLIPAYPTILDVRPVD
jgi:hypothetical protein